MKKVLWIIVISVMAFSVQGQPQRKAFERVHAAKVAYITDRIQLTTKQAEHFWPVYDDFERDRIAIRKKYFPSDKGTDEGNREHGRNNRNYQDRNEGDARQNVEDNLDFQQEELDLKKKYSIEFMKIISAQQLTLLYKAEREFRQLLMQRLRQEKRGHWNGNGGNNDENNNNWR